MKLRILLLALVASLAACQSGHRKSAVTAQKAAVVVPAFNADSAYQFVAAQTAFGPRVPNSEAHSACADYLANTLKRFGAEVTVQEATVRAFDGTPLAMKNIIASYAPQKVNRILLFAHWDSRPFADQDANKANLRKPIDGANDGASGVGVLLEIARQLQQQPLAIGVDIILFDVEDYGKPDFAQGGDGNDSWALGSQYWAKRPHKPGYRARYGILLDMVGDGKAQFTYEGYSTQYAPDLMKQVWETARQLGYGKYFLPQRGGHVVDDHYYVNQAGIPSIDIIDFRTGDNGGFNPNWHTQEDTLDKIDRQTLKAVGQTVLTVIYNER